MNQDYASIKITMAFAEQIAHDLYGLSGVVQALPGELDFNFKIQTELQSYILKVSRPHVDMEYNRYQHELLSHLSRGAFPITAPCPVPDLNGNEVSETRDASGQKRVVRLLSWVEGRLWSEVHPIRPSLLYSLGEHAGQLTHALQDFEHPLAHREFEWDLAQAAWTSHYLHLFSQEQKQILEFFQSAYFAFQDEYGLLRKGVVHNDANDNNVVVSQNLIEPLVHGIIDFGDAIHTQVINDLAIAIAYDVWEKPDPLGAALPVIEGYHRAFPLLEKELKFLHTLIAMRLVMSVSKSAINREKEADNPYLLVSEESAWNLLRRWKQVNADFAHCCFRHACGFPAHPDESRFRHWAKEKNIKLTSLFPTLKKDEVMPLDLSVGSLWVGQQWELENLDHFQYKLDLLQKQEPKRILAGGYLEARTAYTSAAYDRVGNSGSESRTVHLGIDLWVPSGTPVFALFDGEVLTSVNDKGNKEYGGLIILKHRAGDMAFFSLHGHLSPESLAFSRQGQKIKAGDCIGKIGHYPENGNWAPHLHFQLMLSTLGFVNDFPGVAYPGEKEIWRSICPDPNLLFALKELKPKKSPSLAESLQFRKEHLGKSLSLSYEVPLKIVRGDGAYLMDHLGKRYLDTVNNVAHVGHEHPEVVKAGQQQMAVLNTNTRYLHDNIQKFAEALLATFPPALSVVHVVNSGSEANELALRMARAFTGERDMIAVEVGYHGNTSACVEVSSYKFDGKGGKGAPEHTHIVPLPDAYRGIHRGIESGPAYASYLQKQIDHIHSMGRGVAGFICESIISCGGQIELPESYLKIAYDAVRKAGGICIADEVQVGCGRVGSSFWGFQLHGVVPDIVTIGKPIGNGHPLAAVVCTHEVAEAFANGMEYFNTFGGNPVSCAIGSKVLSVIQKEKLQKNALEVGTYLKSELLELSKEFPDMGDIRGQGLFLGIELCDKSKNPLTEKTAYLANRMKERGILMSTDGKDENVLKIKPPLVFSRKEAALLLSNLKEVFKEDFMRS